MTKDNQKPDYPITHLKALSNSVRLMILIECRKNFIEGIKWPQIGELTGLSNGAIKNHIDDLLNTKLIGKHKSNYRITELGLRVLYLVEDLDRLIEVYQ